MEIQALLSLMTVVSSAVKIIADLNACFNFDHNMYLAESSADIDHLVRNGTIPRSLLILNGNNGSDTISSLQKIRSKNTFIIVVPAGSTFQRNLNLLNKVKDFHRLGATVNVGILFQTAASMDDVRNHFLWFKHQSVANIFATAYPHTSIFTFHSFGNFEVINVTNGNACREIYPSLDSNFHRHKFRVLPLVSDLNKQFWTTVFQLMNATYAIHHWKDGVHIVTTLHVFHAKTRPQHMYPLSISHENIIVPEAEPFSGFYAYILTLTSNEFFAYSAGTVAAIVLTLSACRYINQKKVRLLQSFIDVLNLLIINDNGYIAYARLSWSETFVIVPLTFVGFIVVNGYLSSLQSYLTKPALQPKIKTLADIYNSPLKIATFPSYLNSVLERVAYGTHEDWSNRIVAIDDRTLVKQMCTFNISTSYTMGNNDFDMLSGVQRRLKIRGFYDTGITVTRSLSMYPVHESFIFFDKLNDIVHWTHSTGLYQRWLKNAFTTIERDVLAHNRKRINVLVDDDEFEFPIFIAYGWIASIIVLIIEIMWSKIKQRFLSRFL